LACASFEHCPASLAGSTQLFRACCSYRLTRTIRHGSIATTAQRLATPLLRHGRSEASGSESPLGGTKAAHVAPAEATTEATGKGATASAFPSAFAKAAAQKARAGRWVVVIIVVPAVIVIVAIIPVVRI